jgi:hypothetical protein
MLKRALPWLALASFLASMNVTARAQFKGDQALLDALVRKGVLTEKEAQEIGAEEGSASASSSQQFAGAELNCRSICFSTITTRIQGAHN